MRPDAHSWLPMRDAPYEGTECDNSYRAYIRREMAGGRTA